MTTSPGLSILHIISFIKAQWQICFCLLSLLMLCIVTQFWIIALHQRVLISHSYLMYDMWQMFLFLFIRTIWSFKALFFYHCFFFETHESTERFMKLNNWMFCPKTGTCEATWEWMKTQLLNHPREQSRRWADVMTWSPRQY